MALTSRLISQTNLEVPEQVYPAGFLDCACVCVFVCKGVQVHVCLGRMTRIFVELISSLNGSGHLLQFLQPCTLLFGGFLMLLWVDYMQPTSCSSLSHISDDVLPSTG